MKVLIAISAVLAILTGAACLDIAPYPVLDTDAGEEATDAATDADPTDGGGG